MFKRSWLGAAAAVLSLFTPQSGFLLPSWSEPHSSGPGERSRRPSRIQRGTGAGGAGMHRAWKKRRAAGRA